MVNLVARVWIDDSKIANLIFQLSLGTRAPTFFFCTNESFFTCMLLLRCYRLFGSSKMEYIRSIGIKLSYFGNVLFR